MVRHMPWKTPVDPVKWIPAKSGWARTGSPTEAPGAGQEVQHAGREPGLLEEPEHVPVGEQRRGGGLPEHRVAHDGRRGGQVGADGGEVERRDREHEPLERPVLHAVPDARGRDRLLRVDLLGERHVPAPEVDHLAGAVDLGLEDRLRLPEHGGAVQHLPPRAGEQLGGLEEDRGAVGPVHRAPGAAGLAGRLGRQRHLGRTGLVVAGQHVAVPVGHAQLGHAAGADGLPAHDDRDLDLLAGHPGQRGLQGGPLGGSRGVVEVGLVLRGRDVEACVGHWVLVRGRRITPNGSPGSPNRAPFR